MDIEPTLCVIENSFPCLCFCAVSGPIGLTDRRTNRFTNGRTYRTTKRQQNDNKNEGEKRHVTRRLAHIHHFLVYRGASHYTFCLDELAAAADRWRWLSFSLWLSGIDVTSLCDTSSRVSIPSLGPNTHWATLKEYRFFCNFLFYDKD